MICPTCGESTKVIWTQHRRDSEDGATSRRRECRSCEIRFDTREQMLGVPWKHVVKPRGKRKTKETKK